MYHEDEVDGCKEDVWSAGCIFFRMVYGVHPFDTPKKNQLLDTIKQSFKNLWTPPHITIPPTYFNYIQSCLRVNPSDRPTIAKLIKVVKEELERHAFQDMDDKINEQENKPYNKLPKSQSQSNSSKLTKENVLSQYSFTLESQEIIPSGKCKQIKEFEDILKIFF